MKNNKIVSSIGPALCGLGLIGLAGCASIESSPEHTDTAISDGLVYRMPMRQIQVSITIPKNPTENSNTNGEPRSKPQSAPQPGSTVQPSNSGSGGGSAAASGGGQTNGPSSGGAGGSGGNAGQGGNTPGGNGQSAPQNNGGAATTSGEKDDLTIPVQVAATATYPDINYRFVLKYQTNWLGKNELDISIKENGLLTSTGAKTSSGVSEFLTSLAASRGALKAKAFVKQAPDCKEGQTYRLMIDPAKDDLSKSRELCGFKITTARLFLKAPVKEGDKSDSSKTKDSKTPALGSSNGRAEPKDGREQPAVGKRENGVFYRQSLPYQVTVEDPGAPNNLRDFIVFSPSEAPISFLPIRGTFFANNDATIVFNDGMPTGYKQAADGEIVALAKLPADIIGAYFGAIGEAFKARKGVLTTEQEYLASLNALAAERIKRENCKEAVLGSGTDEEILAACAPPDEEEQIGSGGTEGQSSSE